MADRVKGVKGEGENRALPGHRNAERIDNKYPDNPPGGEGDGKATHAGHHAARMGRESKGEKAFES